MRGACAAELGLNVPGVRQSFDPQHQMERAWRLDLTDQDCVDLTEYIASLPRPWRLPPENEKQSFAIIRGELLFGSIGCAGLSPADARVGHRHLQRPVAA